jgi:hypothetical protein
MAQAATPPLHSKQLLWVRARCLTTLQADNDYIGLLKKGTEQGSGLYSQVEDVVDMSGLTPPPRYFLKINQPRVLGGAVLEIEVGSTALAAGGCLCTAFTGHRFHPDSDKPD